MAAGAACLRPSGWLGFTVEQAAEPDVPDGYRLQSHGRYSHTEAYVRCVLSGAGLEPVSIEPAVLRLERHEPVHGLLVMTTKTAV
jgi:predicted TPR repeat methyltransferase